jgi:hypothetical protein
MAAGTVSVLETIVSKEEVYGDRTLADAHFSQIGLGPR